MSKLEKYPAYKDSGVEWLGEIPTHWEIKRIKAILQERKELNKPIKTSNILSLCMYRGVIPYSEKGNAGNKAKDDLTAYKLAYYGDIVLNSMNVIAGSVGLSKYFGAVSPVYYMLYPRTDKEHIEFFNDIFQSAGFQKSLSGLGNGILIKKSESTGKLNTIRMRIPMDKLNNVLIPLPPKQEQIKIASFLDEKTEQLDKAIQQKEQLIKLLKERRQILINDAVTKGLDKTVAMKDSGVEWLGEIPEGWEVKKLFGLCNFIRGNSSFNKDELLNKGKYIALQYGKTYKVDEIDEEYKSYVNDEFYKSSQIVNFGDTIFISTSETIEDLGHSAYYKRRDLGLLGGEQILLKSKADIIDSKYLYFSSKVFSKELQRFATGIKVFRFNINDLKTIYIPLPPKQEQQKIVDYIEKNNQKIDKAINLQQQQITKLKEYKTTLIDSVVTGKVRVV